MVKKIFYVNGIFLLLCLSVFSSSCIAQNCDGINLDSISNPGIYNIASLTQSDGLRNGPYYRRATIYYPTNASPPFASIAIVPGYFSFQSSIKKWGPFLASHGIVVMTIGTNCLFDNPYERRDALLDAIVTLSEENTRTGSPLIGKIDTNRIAVGGWSMGGGGAQLAAAADTSLKAAIAFAPWLNNKVKPADLYHPVPVLIFSGERDAIARPSSHADVYFDYTPQTTNKLLFEIDKTGHFAVKKPKGGQDQVGQITLSWLKQYLIGDNCYCPLLLDAPSSATGYTTNVVCP